MVPKIARQAQRGIGRDGARTMDDLVDPARRYRDIMDEPVLRERQRLQESARSTSPGWIGASLVPYVWASSETSVIVNNRNLVRIW